MHIRLTVVPREGPGGTGVSGPAHRLRNRSSGQRQEKRQNMNRGPRMWRQLGMTMCWPGITVNPSSQANASSL